MGGIIKTFLKYLAFAISAILSPYLVALVFIVIIVYHYSNSFHEFFPWMVTFFVSAILVPGLYVLWLLESKKIKDIHIANPKDRKIPFVLAGVSAIIGTIILGVLDASRQVFLISVIYAVNTILIALVTLTWKISVHMIILSLVSTISVVLFGWQFLWLYLLLIPLGWSRIYRKRHTFWQVLAGGVSAAVLTIIIFWAFGYL